MKHCPINQLYATSTGLEIYLDLFCTFINCDNFINFMPPIFCRWYIPLFSILIIMLITYSVVVYVARRKVGGSLKFCVHS